MAFDKTARQNEVRETLGRLYDEEFIPQLKEYLRRYHEDPTSRVFAPLAETYRRMGKLEEAVKVCQAGLGHHPDFIGGRVALARCLLDQRKWAQAREQLEHVIRCAPENLLAWRLLADSAEAQGDLPAVLHALRIAQLLTPNDVALSEKIRAMEKNVAVSSPVNPEADIQLEPMPARESRVPAPKPPPEEGEQFEVDSLDAVWKPEQSKVRREITTQTLADLYLSQGQFDKALAIFERVAKVESNADLQLKIELCRERLGIRVGDGKHRKVEYLQRVLAKVRKAM